MSEVFEATQDNKKLMLTIKESRLDARCARTFKEKLEEVWNDDIDEVEIDFAVVEFIDSSGIGALLSTHKRLAHSSSPVVLKNVVPQVQTVIELLRLHRIFDIHN